jgi:TetR/AcrR family transcriptional repressor of nem operon
MKLNTKEKILSVGAEIIHRKGFNNTGIQELLKSAEIPKGSFYFYFDSKEDFGLELVDYYQKWISDGIENYVKDKATSPLSQLWHMFEWTFKTLEQSDYKGGCPIGNLSLEMADINENFRIKLDQTIQQIRSRIGAQLNKARHEKEIDENQNIEALSDFLFSSWEGTLLLMKVTKSTAPKEAFFSMIFGKVLQPSYSLTLN